MQQYTQVYNTFNNIKYNKYQKMLNNLRRGADKSFARPGRKQATATKLGIYSTHSQRSSIHFLARCSNFCKPLKKIQNVVRPTGFPRQQWPPRWTIQLFFSVQGTGGSSTGPDPENRVGDQETWSPIRPVSSGLQVPRAGELSCKNKTALVTFPRRFSFKMSFICTSRDN